jgi:hypothetical protein
VQWIRVINININNLRDRYPGTEFLIMGNWNSQIGQVDLPNLFNIIDKWDTNNHYWYESRKSKDKMYNAKGKS